MAGAAKNDRPDNRTMLRRVSLEIRKLDLESESIRDAARRALVGNFNQHCLFNPKVIAIETRQQENVQRYPDDLKVMLFKRQLA